MKLALLASGLMAFAASAQPPQPPTQSPSQPPSNAQPAGDKAPAPTDRAQLRARAERRLADAKSQIERWEAAIKKLDAGAPVSEVEDDMRGPRLSQGGRSQDNNRGPRTKDGGSDRGPMPMGPPGGQGAKLSHEEVLEYLSREFPEISKRFAEAAKDNPGMANRITDRVEPMVREIVSERDLDMKSLRRENFQNGFEMMAASRAFLEAIKKNAPAEDVNKANATLRQALGTHFDLQVKMHQQELVMLQKRVKQLEDDLAEQRQSQKRDEFIQKRIESLQKMPSRERGGEHGERSGGPGAAPKR